MRPKNPTTAIGSPENLAGAPPRRSRDGFSFIELILVLAIMLMITALLVPTLNSMAGPYQLDGAIDSVRAAWAQARARAIQEGQPYRFAIIPETGRYRVAPDTTEYWGNSGSGEPTSTDPNAKPFVLQQQLPSGVVFSVEGGSGANSGANTNNAGQTQRVLADDRADTENSSPEAYSSPIVFLPDGTAREDAQLVFEVKGARPKILQLRGLTGVFSVRFGPP